MKRIGWLVFFLAGCTSPDRSADPSPATPNDLAPEPRAAAPSTDGNWRLAGSNPNDYTYTATKDPADPAKTVRTLRSVASEVNGFGTLMQSFAADKYRGKRVRFTSNVKASGMTHWAGLWMRVDGPGGEVLAFDNMQDRPIKNAAGGTQYDVVLDVPAQARGISLGVLMNGTGELVLGPPSLDVVDTTVAITGKPVPWANAPRDDFKP